MPNDFFDIWLPLVVAALVQASFALSVSMLTLLSGHLLSEKESAARLQKLSFFYVKGSFAATFVGLSTLAFLLSLLSHNQTAQFWSVLNGVATGIGLMVLLFYYRAGKRNGTRLWLPRSAAEYLYQRTRVTKQPFEAFILGAASVTMELVFVAAPLLIAANLIINLSAVQQIAAIFLYVFIVILPLVILFISNSRRRKISEFQKWREKNKKFLQIAAGILLIILGIYLFTYKVIGG